MNSFFSSNNKIDHKFNSVTRCSPLTFISLLNQFKNGDIFYIKQSIIIQCPFRCWYRGMWFLFCFFFLYYLQDVVLYSLLLLLLFDLHSSPSLYYLNDLIINKIYKRKQCTEHWILWQLGCFWLLGRRRSMAYISLITSEFGKCLVQFVRDWFVFFLLVHQLVCEKN